MKTRLINEIGGPLLGGLGALAGWLALVLFFFNAPQVSLLLIIIGFLLFGLGWWLAGGFPASSHLHIPPDFDQNDPYEDPPEHIHIHL